MEQTIYYKERQKGYKEALKETKKSHRSSFENQIKLSFISGGQNGSQIMKDGSK